jgi:DNA-binding IclR family transcriptional regulator
MTEKTVVDWKLIDAAAERVDICGYAVNCEEGYDGVTGVAAPVWARDGSFAGAISVIGPSERMIPVDERIGPTLTKVIEREFRRGRTHCESGVTVREPSGPSEQQRSEA